MSTNQTASSPAGGRPVASGTVRVKSRPGDRVFFGLSFGSAALIMVILAAVALFLIVRAAPAIAADWHTNAALNQGATAGHHTFWGYVAPLIFGTVWAAAIGLIIGAPIAIGIALFISHYAPRRLAGILGYLVDLLAAVPSVIFGLWGIFVVRPFFLPLENWLSVHLGWIPLFAGQPTSTGSTILAGGIVLAVMILPIITSISRQIFLQTPLLHEEAALALGATKWETIRLAVFPYARSGVVSAILLGLGRALGETMAYALIVSGSLTYSLKLLTDGSNPQTIAANLALNFPESNGLQRQALIGTGLMLFVISLVVNFAARGIVARTGGSSKGQRAAKRAAALAAATPATIAPAVAMTAAPDATGATPTAPQISGRPKSTGPISSEGAPA